MKMIMLCKECLVEPVIDEVKAVTRDNWQQMLAGWTDRFGDAVALSPMTENDHERIDPQSELAEMVHPDRIITVQP